ncbi:MAG: type IV pilus modification protein PilV [Pseudomonadales bacterium]
MKDNAQSGFTLIEILVTMLVMAIGFMGLAALQTTGLQQSQSTYFRTQADILARDIADRMRANRFGVLSGSYEFAGAAVPADQGCVASGADCTELEMATQDLHEWMLRVQTLPSGDATVVANGSLQTVTIMWDELRTGAAGTNCDPNDPADLACLVINVEI